MRNIPPALKQAFLDGTRSVIIKVTTKTGAVFGYTDHDVDLVIDGVTYVATPALLKLQLSRSVNDTVSNQEFGSAWVDAPEDKLRAGEFDNAEIEIAFCNWKQPADGKYVVDRGRLGVIQWTADGFRADMQSWMRELQKTITLVSTAQCRHQVFNQLADITKGTHMGACRLNRADYKCDAVVNSWEVGSLVFRFTITSGSSTIVAGLENTWFSHGTVVFRNEADRLIDDIPFMIKKSTLIGANQWEVELYLPLPVHPAGTDIDVYPGCDKTITSCKNKFNNVVNFGGFPHIKPEVLYR